MRKTAAVMSRPMRSSRALLEMTVMPGMAETGVVNGIEEMSREERQHPRGEVKDTRDTRAGETRERSGRESLEHRERDRGREKERERNEAHKKEEMTAQEERNYGRGNGREELRNDSRVDNRIESRAERTGRGRGRGDATEKGEKIPRAIYFVSYI